jgi:hypothetical protein
MAAASHGITRDKLVWTADAYILRFCPRLRDFPDRKLACIEPITAYKDLQSLLGRIRPQPGDRGHRILEFVLAAVRDTTLFETVADVRTGSTNLSSLR